MIESKRNRYKTTIREVERIGIQLKKNGRLEQLSNEGTEQCLKNFLWITVLTRSYGLATSCLDDF
jgi:hypothetical protein